MIDLLDPNHVDMVRSALRDWLPGQAQMVLDMANHRISHDTDWTEDDDFATQCESLAVVARKIATMGQEAVLSPTAVQPPNADTDSRPLGAESPAHPR